MKTKIFVLGQERTLLSFNVSHHKNTAFDGKPLSFALGSEKLRISFVQEFGDEVFLNWMLLKDKKTQECGFYERGKIVIYDSSGLDKKVEQYDFIAKPIAYESVFHHEKGLIINMTLSADRMLVYNDAFFIKPYYYPVERVKQKEEEEDITEITEMYYTDLEGNRIGKDKFKPETTIFLNVKGRNLAGEKGTFSLNDEKVDFEYEGRHLKNDVLEDYLCGDNSFQIELKVIEPKN